MIIGETVEARDRPTRTVSVGVEPDQREKTDLQVFSLSQHS